MFTIENLIEKIYEPKSKELFKDIYTSYTQGQYRATIVMLWTAVICDLIYKLQYLRDVYNDQIAIKILEEIANKQKKNSKSSEWEKFLIEEINTRTQLITTIEKENLEYLQKQRNLCAHPIITNDNILFTPNKELTRSLMRIALDSVLLKAPLLTKNYIDTVLNDLEKRGDDFIFWDEVCERYVENRYLKHLNLNQILALFKVLWRFVFMPHNNREENNAYVNYNLLKHIFKKYKSECLNSMKNNIDSYSYYKKNNIARRLFNTFIVENYQIYSVLSEPTKAIFKSEVRIFPKNIPYFFLYEMNFQQYLTKLDDDFNNRKETIQPDSLGSVIPSICNQAKEHNLKEVLLNLFITWYSKSSDYDEANVIFDELIKNNIKNFSLQQIEKLIALASKNNQTYDRKRAKQDHRFIIQKYIQLNGTYDRVKGTPFEELFNIEESVPF